jgi:hypothetical protein
MRLLLAVFTAALPIPHGALLKIDRAASYDNFLPTRAYGLAYSGWAKKGGVVRVEFRSKAGVVVEWRVERMTGSCDTGKQQSFQLGGNKVWWAQQGATQFAWRCAFDLAGKEVRFGAATTALSNKYAPAGLGAIAASAKRY